MASFVAAISRASTSAVSRANAFFFPSGLVMAALLASRLAELDKSPSISVSNIPNQRVHPYAVYLVEFLDGIFDLPLVRLDIHYEDQRVVLLDFLHRTLRIQRMDDDLVRIETGDMRYGFAGVLGVSGEPEGLRSVESGRSSNFPDFVFVVL